MQWLRETLGGLAGHDGVRDALCKVLMPLVCYDARRGTDLLFTLTTHVRNGGNIAATAEALFVHRNSVLYRLQRVEDVAGIDSRDVRVREVLLIGLALAGESLLQDLRASLGRYDNAG